MIDSLLQICFKGTFEKLEVAVRVGVLMLLLCPRVHTFLSFLDFLVK